MRPLLIFLALILIVPMRLLAAPMLRGGFIPYDPIVTPTLAGPEGYLMDYLRPVFKAADISADWKALAVNRGIHQLEQGQLDLFLTLMKTPEREYRMRFSSVPLFAARSALCARAGALDGPFTRPLRIAHYMSTVLPPSLQSHQLVAVSPEDVTRRLLFMLGRGRVDAIFYANPEILAFHFDVLPADFQLECAVFSDLTLQIHMAYAKTLAPAIANRLDRSLAREMNRRNFAGYLQGLLNKIDHTRLKIVARDSRSFMLEPQATSRM